MQDTDRKVVPVHRMNMKTEWQLAEKYTHIVTMLLNNAILMCLLDQLAFAERMAGLYAPDAWHAQPGSSPMLDLMTHTWKPAEAIAVAGGKLTRRCKIATFLS